MKHRIIQWLCLVIIGSTGLNSHAQKAAREMPHCDFFMGADFNYRNIHYNNRLYDLLINLTPGVKLVVRTSHLTFLTFDFSSTEIISLISSGNEMEHRQPLANGSTRGCASSE